MDLLLALLQQENRGSSIQLQEDFESKQNLAIT
jgi:hypothetical protein